MLTFFKYLKQAFNEYSPEKANRIWLTLHLVMKEIMKIAGANRYKIPHINKERLERLHLLPLQVDCEASIVDEAKATLAANN